MSFKYYCMNPISKAGIDRFKENYEKTEQIENADAVLVRSADMKELELPKSLKAIARAGAGVNNIPLDKCAEKGIVVFNTPGANANGVKELVIAGMLLASRDIVGGIEWVEEQKDKEDIGKLAEKSKKKFAGCEISGKKLGVIGLGTIGVQVANTAVHLGMEVLGYDPFISVDAAWNLSRSIHHINDIEQIYRESDYITIHVPLNEHTKGMVDEKAISMMKDGVVLLNFARDAIVDENKVVEALKEGHMKKYVTDFANPIIAGVENTLITPHLGASTEESEDNCAIMAVKELSDFLQNGNIKNSVNFPGCDMGTCVTTGRVVITHKNIVNMIGQFTKVFADNKVNISDMLNKSKGEYAYSMFDVDCIVKENVLEQLRQIEGVSSVRAVK